MLGGNECYGTRVDQSTGGLRVMGEGVQFKKLGLVRVHLIWKVTFDQRLKRGNSNSLEFKLEYPRIRI